MILLSSVHVVERRGIYTRGHPVDVDVVAVDLEGGTGDQGDQKCVPDATEDSFEGAGGRVTRGLTSTQEQPLKVLDG
jgi:hypothetical protein